jgi:hypothetical protein
MLRRFIVSVARTAPGTYVGGRFVDGAKTVFIIKCSVQPTSPKEMVSLDEGRRTRNAYTLISDRELFMSEPSTERNSDHVTLFGERYEVMSCERWQNNLLNHYKAIVSKVCSAPVQ